MRFLFNGTYVILVLLTIAVRASWGEEASLNARFYCECPGPEGSEPVCGVDGQTYGNECLLNCSNVKLAYRGSCDLEGCYPWGGPVCSGDFEANAPHCAIGLTWTNVAEAKCAGTGKSNSCIVPGVCQYRADNQSSYLPGLGFDVDIKAIAANTIPPPRDSPQFDYAEALTKILLFYDSMISGNISGACRRRLAWRDDSCLSCIGDFGEDLSGGFYEAGGSTLKYPSVISGFSATMMAWAGIEFYGTMLRTGVLDDLKWKVKWAADHVVAAHPKDFAFVAFLGNATDDFDFYGPPEYYEKYNPPRKVAYVTKSDKGSEILADASATLAAALVLGVSEEPAWRENALNHARALYDWAKTDPGSYRDAKSEGLKMMADMYPSGNGFWDDLSWAATWMYKATGEEQYLEEAKEFLNKAGGLEEQSTFETGYKTPGAAILLAKESQDPNALKLAQNYFEPYVNTEVMHTKGGAAYPYHWGALRHAGNLGFLSFVHASNPAVDEKYQGRLRNYGAHQTNYILGSSGRSWIVGFGEDYPQYLHHKMSYNSILTWKKDNEPLGEKIYMVPPQIGGPWAPEHAGNASGQYIQRAKFDFEGSYFPQKHIAWGTLFGSPLMDDGIVNSRRDYTYAEPTVEYNAGAFGAVAALADWFNVPAWEGNPESLEGVIPFSCETTLKNESSSVPPMQPASTPPASLPNSATSIPTPGTNDPSPSLSLVPSTRPPPTVIDSLPSNAGNATTSGASETTLFGVFAVMGLMACLL